MQRPGNEGDIAAETPEESLHYWTLFYFERHVRMAQEEAIMQLRMDAPHKRVLSYRYVWNWARKNAITWALEQRHTLDAGHLEAFLSRMEESRKASNRLARESRRRRTPQ